MAEFTNAHKLAVVVAEWSRPAFSQITASTLCKIPALRSLQSSVVSLGLVPGTYSIADEFQPFVRSALDSLLAPMLTKHLSGIPDEAIPALAHSVVAQAMQQPKFSILDGLVEFEQSDLVELKDLLDKNLPICELSDKYTIIH